MRPLIHRISAATVCASSLLLSFAGTEGAELQKLSRHLPQVAENLAPVGRVAAGQRLNLSIAFPLRNREALTTLVEQLYDPSSPNYRHYLTPEQFGERYGATEVEYQAVIEFMKANGLVVMKTHPNRLVVDIQGTVAEVERVMHVTMRQYQHPKEARTFYAPDVDPSLDLSVPVLQIGGLNNYSLRYPKLHKQPLERSNSVSPRSGSGPSGYYIGKDFRNAYVPGANNLTGTGQMVGLLQFDSYYAADIATYISTANIATSVVLTNVAVDGGPGSPGDGNGEVTLDIQMVIAMAPGVSKIFVFEAPQTTTWFSLLSTMASYSSIKQFSCSWGDNTAGSPDYASEGIFVQMAAQGQSFYNATGDSDAIIGGLPFPSESTNITQVGATTLTMSGSGAAYSSETVWNWGLYSGSYVGSSGGVSANFPIPSYQQGISMTANKGSTTKRNVPDVALTGDNVYNVSDNGSTGSVGGTSCAAPLWAGFTALINQQAVANGQGSVGFLNPAIYALAKGSSYGTAFHDITTGNNTNTSSANKYFAVTGFDLCTGWGTPTGTNLINALAGPPPVPGITGFSPASGVVNTTVTISGSNFVTVNSVTFNGLSAAFTVNSAAQVTAVVPLTATTGPIVVVAAGGPATSASNFTVLDGPPAPAVSGFSPAYGPANGSVVISGQYFTNVSTVSFNGTSASFTVDSPTQITATVPAGATTGPLSVVTSSGPAASASSFSVLSGDGAPTVTSFTPASGMANASVTITGGNFAGVTAVTFNGVSASFTVNSLTQITASVPSGATTGPVAVSNPYGTGTSSSAFTFVASPLVAISQIFGGGGSSSAPYLNDYVELYNRGPAAVDLSNWSLQYASYNGSTWSKTSLAGTIQPGHYYLIQEASGGSTGSTLPTADAAGSINLSSTHGKVALVENQTTLAGANPAGGTGIADFVGYGTATAYEGSGPAPAPSTTAALFRANGGGTDTDNNAADFATGAPAPRNSSTGPSAPDLAVTVSHSGSFAQGDTGDTYTILVTNVGAAASTGVVTVVDTLPAGLTATAISGTGWTATLGTLTGTRSEALAAGAAYPAITVTVNVSASAAASVTNSATVSGGGESNTANNTGIDPTTITVMMPDLAVALTHAGNFTQGDAADVYTITVTNVGTLATTGTVTVVDSLPAGLTATALSGSGWTTSLGTRTAIRSDSLAPGAAIPAITLTVSVATNAPSLVTNWVSVSTGGDANSANDTVSNITSILAASNGGGIAYTGILAGWDVSGSSNFGSSPQTPTTNAAKLTVGGLTRGTGVTTTGSAASTAWGGAGFDSTTAAAAVTAGDFATFSFTASAGCSVSFSSVSRFDYRRSSSGPPNGVMQYQVGAGAFVSFVTNSYLSGSSGASLSAIDLSGIAALQNVGPGANVTFRIVNYGATSSGGTWYVYDVGKSTALDFTILGAVMPLSGPPAAAPVLSLLTVVSNQLQFTLTGTAGSNYVIEACTDLTTNAWTPVQTGAAPILVVQPATNDQRYYRGKAQP